MRRRAPWRSLWAAVLASLFSVCATAAPAAGQFPELPTLSELGLEYLSSSGFLQATLSGRLDLEGLHRTNGWEPGPAERTACEACHVALGRSFQAGEGLQRTYRLRMFGDLFLGDHLYARVEVRSDRGRESLDAAPRVRLDQAFVTLSSASGATGVQVGRFASPFGSYAARHLSQDDHFLNAPLVYDYRTVLNRWRVPGSAGGLLGWQDSPDDLDLPGAPPIWEVPYQWGAMVFGRRGALELEAAVMNSSPSSNPNAWRLQWSRFERPSWVVAARWRVSASLEMGASYDRGPWMEPPRAGTIGPPPGSPPGTPAPGFRDFDQELISVDVAYARGATMVRAEAVRDRWEVPNVADRPLEMGYNVEVQRDLAAGFFAALRGGWIDFRGLDDGLADASPYPDGRREWDHDVARYEGALGYRLSRNTGVLLSGYRQLQEGAPHGDTDFVGLRLWWAF